MHTLTQNERAALTALVELYLAGKLTSEQLYEAVKVVAKL